MIRFIAAVDSKLGMATDKGIPWHPPIDIAYFREQTQEGAIMMGFGTYVEFAAPLHGRTNYVATNSSESLRDGFEPVHDAVNFLQTAKSDVWVIGGPGLFAQTIQLAEELYLMRIAPILIALSSFRLLSQDLSGFRPPRLKRRTI